MPLLIIAPPLLQASPAMSADCDIHAVICSSPPDHPARLGSDPHECDAILCINALDPALEESFCNFSQFFSADLAATGRTIGDNGGAHHHQGASRGEGGAAEGAGDHAEGAASSSGTTSAAAEGAAGGGIGAATVASSGLSAAHPGSTSRGYRGSYHCAPKAGRVEWKVGA